MRILWLLGCLVSASTAYAQPADKSDARPTSDARPMSDARPTSDAAPVSDASPIARPATPPPASAPPAATLPPTAVPVTPCASPSCSSLPIAAPGMVPARAPVADPVEGTAPAGEPETESYRWQIALVDAGSVTLLLTGKSPAVSIAAFSYLLGGPIIHAAHDKAGRMLGSLALRLTLPLAGAFGLAALAAHNSSCTPQDDDCDSGALFGAIFGFGLGALAAMVVDTAVMARPLEVHRTTGIAWAPRLDVTSQHVNLGVVGRF
jgi:hypothetical protein